MQGYLIKVRTLFLCFILPAEFRYSNAFSKVWANRPEKVKVPPNTRISQTSPYTKWISHMAKYLRLHWWKRLSAKKFLKLQMNAKPEMTVIPTKTLNSIQKSTKMSFHCQVTRWSILRITLVTKTTLVIFNNSRV